jgi:hypothetical protein
MTPPRIVARPGRGVVVALIVAVVAVGCAKPPQPTASIAGGKPGEPAPASPTASPSDPKADAEAFARQFLTAANEGTATAEMLTAEFKKVIAEPVFPSDQELGYSDAAARQWLQRLQGRLSGASIQGPHGSGDVFVMTGSGGANQESSYALRVVRGGNGWQVDGFVLAEGIGERQEVYPPGDGTYVGFAAVAFLQALLGKDDRLAEGLMTQEHKAALAPPLPSDTRGYNRGLLARRLVGLRGDFTGYRVSQIEGDTVGGELTRGDVKKPLTLKLVRGDRSWDWRVNAFKAE